MWASLNTSAQQSPDSSSQAAAPTNPATSAPEVVESADDLNAALLMALGENQHKRVRKTCASLIRKEASIEQFHENMLEVFQDGDMVSP